MNEENENSNNMIKCDSIRDLLSNNINEEVESFDKMDSNINMDSDRFSHEKNSKDQNDINDEEVENDKNNCNEEALTLSEERKNEFGSINRENSDQEDNQNLILKNINKFITIQNNQNFYASIDSNELGNRENSGYIGKNIFGNSQNFSNHYDKVINQENFEKEKDEVNLYYQKNNCNSYYFNKENYNFYKINHKNYEKNKNFFVHNEENDEGLINFQSNGENIKDNKLNEKESIEKFNENIGFIIKKDNTDKKNFEPLKNNAKNNSEEYNNFNQYINTNNSQKRAAYLREDQPDLEDEEDQVNLIKMSSKNLREIEFNKNFHSNILKKNLRNLTKKEEKENEKFKFLEEQNFTNLNSNLNYENNFKESEFDDNSLLRSLEEKWENIERSKKKKMINYNKGMNINNSNNNGEFDSLNNQRSGFFNNKNGFLNKKNFLTLENSEDFPVEISPREKDGKQDMRIFMLDKSEISDNINNFNNLISNKQSSKKNTKKLNKNFENEGSNDDNSEINFNNSKNNLRNNFFHNKENRNRNIENSNYNSKNKFYEKEEKKTSQTFKSFNNFKTSTGHNFFKSDSNNFYDEKKFKQTELAEEDDLDLFIKEKTLILEKITNKTLKNNEDNEENFEKNQNFSSNKNPFNNLMNSLKLNYDEKNTNFNVNSNNQSNNRSSNFKINTRILIKKIFNDESLSDSNQENTIFSVNSSPKEKIIRRKSADEKLSIVCEPNLSKNNFNSKKKRNTSNNNYPDNRPTFLKHLDDDKDRQKSIPFDNNLNHITQNILRLNNQNYLNVHLQENNLNNLNHIFNNQNIRELTNSQNYKNSVVLTNPNNISNLNNLNYNNTMNTNHNNNTNQVNFNFSTFGRGATFGNKKPEEYKNKLTNNSKNESKNQQNNEYINTNSQMQNYEEDSNLFNLNYMSKKNQNINFETINHTNPNIIQNIGNKITNINIEDNSDQPCNLKDKMRTLYSDINKLNGNNNLILYHNDNNHYENYENNEQIDANNANLEPNLNQNSDIGEIIMHANHPTNKSNNVNSVNTENNFTLNNLEKNFDDIFVKITPNFKKEKPFIDNLDYLSFKHNNKLNSGNFTNNISNNFNQINFNLNNDNSNLLFNQISPSNQSNPNSNNILRSFNSYFNEYMGNIGMNSTKNNMFDSINSFSNNSKKQKSFILKSPKNINNIRILTKINQNIDLIDSLFEKKNKNNLINVSSANLINSNIANLNRNFANKNINSSMNDILKLNSIKNRSKSTKMGFFSKRSNLIDVDIIKMSPLSKLKINGFSKIQ